MPPKSFRARPFIPTTSRAGGETPAIFRGKNMILRGRPPDRLYLECYAGSRDLSENIPDATLTGTLSSTGDKVVTGSGTLFLTELHIGQIVLASDRVMVVDEVISDTEFRVVGTVGTSFSAVNGFTPPVLFEVNQKRGSQIFGNAIQFDKGTILGVGSGTLRLNGAVLPGTSFVAGRTPKVAIFDPATGNYSVYSLGMATPATPTLTAIGGGVKNMQAGDYSIRLTPARIETAGFNNPSEKVKVTIATGDKIRITLPAADTAKGQNAFGIHGTQFTANQAINGPWYRIKRNGQELLRITARGTVAINTGNPTVTGTNTFFLEDFYAGDVVTIQGNSYTISSIASNTSMTLTTNALTTGSGQTVTITGAVVEWLDAEIARNELLEFDNFPPGEAEFVASLGGNPVYLSCFGRTGGAPGANLVPVKPRNIEGALVNLNLRLDPPDTIIGWRVALGRLYLLTINSLQIGTLQSVGNFPITTRPFWKRGFHNPYSLIFVNDRLYGWTEVGLTRSAFDGERGSEEFELAADIMELTRRWTDGKVYTVHDPVNELVCVVHSADSQQNVSPFYWRSVILPYSLQLECWMPPVVLESTTGDMIVSGVATVGNRFYFIAGGRQQAGGRTWRTYEFDSLPQSGFTTIPWYLAWQFADDGAEEAAKRVKSYRITGQITNAFLGIYGAAADENVDTDVLEQGTGGASGSINVGSFSQLHRGKRETINVPELNLYTVRINGTWDQVDQDRDRIDEIALDIGVRKMRQ